LAVESVELAILKSLLTQGAPVKGLVVDIARRPDEPTWTLITYSKDLEAIPVEDRSRVLVWLQSISKIAYDAYQIPVVVVRLAE